MFESSKINSIVEIKSLAFHNKYPTTLLQIRLSLDKGSGRSGFNLANRIMRTRCKIKKFVPGHSFNSFLTEHVLAVKL